MIVDGIRLYAALLEDPDTGLNAVLPRVPRDADDPAPPAVGLYDQVRHPWVARYQVAGEILADGPALLLYQLAEVELPAAREVVSELPPALFVLTYVRRDDDPDVDSAAIARDAAQTLRAAAAVLNAAWLGRPGARAVLIRNGVRFDAPELFRYQARQPSPDHQVVDHSLFIGLRAADPFARGAIPAAPSAP